MIVHLNGLLVLIVWSFPPVNCKSGGVGLMGTWNKNAGLKGDYLQLASVVLG